jgi:hypothetical protein
VGTTLDWSSAKNLRVETYQSEATGKHLVRRDAPSLEFGRLGSASTWRLNPLS